MKYIVIFGHYCEWSRVDSSVSKETEPNETPNETENNDSVGFADHTTDSTLLEEKGGDQ